MTEIFEIMFTSTPRQICIDSILLVHISVRMYNAQNTFAESVQSNVLKMATHIHTQNKQKQIYS
jgi:hypothetical protein